ncbi:hypothetical protein Ahy_A03g013285 [Arachis hypogaea]|uniref:Lipoxygenase domain-containing protein n=1 Tax=Arachis hypogaea TaxID=3818 RepID=A0A445DV56_ARAHY|nr:hypothetical protein Ahy_A03g013285 [Arachis hypogaea]
MWPKEVIAGGDVTGEDPGSERRSAIVVQWGSKVCGLEPLILLKRKRWWRVKVAPFSLSFLLSYPKHITPSDFFPLFPISPALSSFRTKLRVHSSVTPSHGSSPCTTSSHGSATPRHATTAALLHRTAAAALLLRKDAEALLLRKDAAALLRRTTSSPCSSALLRVSFANRAASASSIPARFALSSTTGLEADLSYKSTHSFLGFGGNQKVIYANFITILMGQNNKVKDTNNRNARVIYDAKEVINGLQAPIVKDAERFWLIYVCSTNQMDNVDKRPGMLRSPKYTNKRVDEVFSARKSKFGVVSGKENAKENPSLEKTTTSNLKNVLLPRDSKGVHGEVNNDGVLQACQTTAECSQVNFRSVSELFSTADKSSGLTAVDVGKALRGLAAPKPCARTGLAADSTERCGDMISSFAANSISEYHILGRKAPLDLTLKTGDRFFWFRDEEFARQTVAGLNPLSISLVER